MLYDEVSRLKSALMSGMLSKESISKIQKHVEELELQLYSKDDNKAKEVIEKNRKQRASASADALVNFLMQRGGKVVKA